MRIAANGVRFSYDGVHPVVRSIDLAVAGGELLALIGANGSGKSTLLRLISGVLRPESGGVVLGETPIRDLSTRQIAQRLAMVEQDRQIGFDFSVREMVAMGRTPHRGRFARESDDDRDAIERALAMADVEVLAGRSVHAISGGEQQRVFLAMALAQETSALLLDEPTTHLDLRHQVEFLSIVRESSKEGRTVLIAMHDLTMAAQVVDRIGLMSEGTLRIVARPDAVLTPRNLAEAFGVDVHVGQDPASGATYILPWIKTSDSA